MLKPFAIAGVQMYVSALESNVPRMQSRLDVVMQLYPWVQMVVFSELCGHGPFTATAQPMPGPTEAVFQEMARRHGIWLIPGSIYESVGGVVYNTAPVIDPYGNVVARHRKIFPFLPYENGVEAGEEFVVFDVPDVGRFGVSICYDMWFPETSRTLATLGAEVILHPTLTGSIDREVELSIAKATAAFNQCFVIDVNGLGDGGNGHSIFVGPAGETLYQAGTAPEVIPLEIDLGRVQRSREVGLRGLGQPLKSFRDRRIEFDVYRPGQRPEYLKTLGPLEKMQRGRSGSPPGAPPSTATPAHEGGPDPMTEGTA